MMREEKHLGVTTRYSRNNLFKVEIHKETVMNGVTYYAAVISKKSRSFWQPLLSGINLTEAEIEGYFTQDV
jgi:hypothetical protein